jgi:hypothetical protein
VLDQLLFGSELKRSSYGFGKYTSGPRLIKPHGSLNWYHSETGKFLKDDSKFLLTGVSVDRIFAFRHFRSPVSSRREYMPLIVPPVYMKQFQGDLFRHLWQETVSVISTASEVRFLGYSLPSADFHARFILRCGFHNQEEGALLANGERANATGRAKVTVVDPDNGGGVNARISDAVGWSCDHRVATIEEWMTT